MGIEPTSLAWEARVMAIIRRPQRPRFYRVFGGLGRWVVLAAGTETGIARGSSGGSKRITSTLIRLRRRLDIEGMKFTCGGGTNTTRTSAKTVPWSSRSGAHWYCGWGAWVICATIVADPECLALARGDSTLLGPILPHGEAVSC